MFEGNSQENNVMRTEPHASDAMSVFVQKEFLLLFQVVLFGT